MFTKALIATDASPASHAVVGCARDLHRLGVRECILTQCFEIREHVAFPDQIREHIKATLAQQKQVLEQHGLRVTVVAEPGLPGTEIPRIAERMDCSLIVAGSHGHSFAAEVLLGSTAGEILHQAKTPVLIVRLAANEATGQVLCAKRDGGFLRSVLHPTDFSDHAEYAFAYVRELVARGAHHVILLHVQDRTRLGAHLDHRLEEFNSIDRRRMEDLRRRLTADGGDRIQIDIRIPFGSPTEEILKHSERTDPGLIVMGSHGRGFVSEMFLGSVSHNIARHAKASVLLIPGEPRRD